MGTNAIRRSKLARKKCIPSRNENGAMLVEVLVATMILALIFGSVVTQLSNLASTRVRIETRDRVVAYVNSLHEKMSANGCGFDVDTVEETVFQDEFGNYIQGESSAYAGSNQVVLRGPWNRVEGCAFSAHEKVREAAESDRQYSYVDLNDVVHLTVNQNGTPDDDPITRDVASEFCKLYGESGSQFSDTSCELGDQDFKHLMTVNDDGNTTIVDVSVRYWFEVVGADTGTPYQFISRKSQCSDVINSNKLPDTLARRVEVKFNNGKGGEESFVITKRENVPVDSFQFASGTRVGVAVSSGDSASMYPNPDVNSPWKISRVRSTPSSCIWFPYISRHQAGEVQPSFSIDGAGAVEMTLSEIPALQTGLL